MLAEYIALTMAMWSLIHLCNIHHKVVKALQLPWTIESSISTVYKDNQACLILATIEPPRHMPQSHMIAAKYHWFCKQLGKDTIHVEKIDGKLQHANILTKALS